MKNDEKITFSDVFLTGFYLSQVGVKWVSMKKTCSEQKIVATNPSPFLNPPRDIVYVRCLGLNPKEDLRPNVRVSGGFPFAKLSKSDMFVTN